MKRKKSIALVAIVLLMTVSLLAGCSQSPQPEAPAPGQTEQPAAPSGDSSGEKRGPGDYDYTIATIQYASEAFVQTYIDAAVAAAEYAGMTVIQLLSENSADKEMANVEDMISRGVDAIVLFAFSSETAQVIAQVCEEANMPLFVMDVPAADGPAKPTSTIMTTWYDLGYMCGEWIAQNVPGELKIMEVQGMLGLSIAEGTSEGFADALSVRDDVEIVYSQTANWLRAEAITITEDQLMSGLDFNFVFAQSEYMAGGVISVLEENGVLGSEVQVVSMNGSDEGLENIRAGNMLATGANPPTLAGGGAVVQILRYFDGEPVDELYSPGIFMIDSSNVDDPDLVTWDNKWAIGCIDAYFAGTFS